MYKIIILTLQKIEIARGIGGREISSPDPRDFLSGCACYLHSSTSRANWMTPDLRGWMSGEGGTTVDTAGVRRSVPAAKANLVRLQVKRHVEDFWEPRIRSPRRLTGGELGC